MKHETVQVGAASGERDSNSYITTSGDVAGNACRRAMSIASHVPRSYPDGRFRSLGEFLSSRVSTGRERWLRSLRKWRCLLDVQCEQSRTAINGAALKLALQTTNNGNTYHCQSMRY